MPFRGTPQTMVKRLPVYLRTLDSLILHGVDIVSSHRLSEEAGYTAEQIRKDLAFFGAFGTRGSGYETIELRDQLLRIMGLQQQRKVILIGAGQLGTALARYTMEKNPYVILEGIFDKAPEVIDREIMGKKVRDVLELPDFIMNTGIKLAIVSVPSHEAEDVINLLVEAGINAILNFAPIRPKVPEGVHLQNVDLTLELQSLIYHITSKD